MKAGVAQAEHQAKHSHKACSEAQGVQHVRCRQMRLTQSSSKPVYGQFPDRRLTAQN